MKTKDDKRRALLIAAAFLMAWFSALLVLFPVGNPFVNASESAGGSGGWKVVAVTGQFAVGIGLFILLVFTITRALSEIGLDSKQLWADYKQLCKNELLILIGRKDRPSEHEVDDD